jgi:hypothetical protein
MRRMVKPVVLTAVVVGVVAGGTIWYAAAHPRGHQHYDSCAVQPDGSLVLRYGHGIGDKVTASAQSTRTAVVVSLYVKRAPGDNPAVLLHGELRFDPGSLDGRSVVDVDGTVLSCSQDS